MDPFEREEMREEERSRTKKERRDFRKHQEAVTCNDYWWLQMDIYDPYCIIGRCLMS